ncbi:MAG: hypothetical protein E5W55_02240 [Mesorhizobium sp.]|nr:MAG: hypothetical protein E5W55_02240 [Mesorhizobium sp.]
MRGVLESILAETLQKTVEDLDDRIRAVTPVRHSDLIRVLLAAVASERENRHFTVNDAIAAMPSKRSARTSIVEPKPTARKRKAMLDPQFQTKYKRLQAAVSAGLLHKRKSTVDGREKIILPTDELRNLIAEHEECIKQFVSARVAEFFLPPIIGNGGIPVTIRFSAEFEAEYEIFSLTARMQISLQLSPGSLALNEKVGISIEFTLGLVRFKYGFQFEDELQFGKAPGGPFIGLLPMPISE